MELRNRVDSEKNYVDPSTVFKGLDYYRFLMESLPPASIPGKKFISKEKMFTNQLNANSFFKMFLLCQLFSS